LVKKFNKANARCHTCVTNVDMAYYTDCFTLIRADIY
jgi:hypothetical protein